MRIKREKEEGADRNKLLLQLKELTKENNQLKSRNLELEEKSRRDDELINKNLVLQHVPDRLVLSSQLSEARSEIIQLKDRIKWLEGLFKK